MLNTPKYIPHLPYHLVWIATNACNARCIHCSTAAAKQLHGELTTSEAKQLFSHLASIGIFDIAISGGEPLVRKDIFEIIDYMTSLGIKVGIGSNGSTINSEKARELKRVKISRLQISIDGTEKVHDIARRWDGLFDRAKHSIEVSRQAGLDVNVCMTVHRLNYPELEEVINICANWGVKRFNMSRFIPTGRGDKSLDLHKDTWKELIFEFEELRKHYEGMIELSTHLSQCILVNPLLENIPGFIGCQAGIGQGCIGSTGDISPCVMLPLKIGNVRYNSFGEIWKSSDLINSLKKRSSIKGSCGLCRFKETCGGCRAVAYSYTGDVFETDQRCWLTN